MNARDLLERLDDLGVGLTLAGDRIRYRSRGDELPAELLAEMKDNRDELVSILTRRGQLRWPPARDGSGDDDRRGPLTRTQQTLWATDYFLDDGTYNLCGALQLHGRLDDRALLAALDDVHRRHPSLRTVFDVEQGEPRQHILPLVAPPVVVGDLTHRPPAAALQECLAECALLADGKLPLDAVPPVRTRLYRLTEDDHVFAIVLHHVIADAVSVRVLIEDLARCYNARLDDDPAGAPDGDLDMIDYALWEEERLQFADLGAARRYWKGRLSGATLGALPLPPPLPDSRSDHRGGAVTAVVDTAATAAVREVVSASRSSVFIVVSAAICAMLSRYTGRDDLVLGLPVHRRDRDGLDRLVGLLLDMVPVRLDVGGGPTFLDLIKRTRAAVLGAAGNAVAPVEVMAGGRTTRGDAAGRALFNVVLTDIGTELPVPQFRGLDTRQLQVAQIGAKFDLNFLIRDDGDTLNIDVEFSRRAVSEPDVVAMTSMAREILARGAADPLRRAADLATSAPGAAGAGAVGARPDRVPGQDESLSSRLAQVAQTRGDAIALSHDGTTLSYRGLANLVDQVAAGLRQEGLGAGDVVAVSLPRGIDLVVAILGIMACGAACLVLDDAWPRARADRVLADAGARRIIAEESDGTGERVTVAQLAEAGAGAGAAAAPSGPVPSHAIAYVIYTSGSTGRPKGVQVSHRNVLSLLDATSSRFGFDASDTWTLFHACSFDVSMWEMFGCLLHGGRLAVVPKWITREPDAFAQLLRRERVTVLCQTPSALSVMLPAIARSPGAAEHIRYVLFAGEALDRRLADQWYRAIGDRTQLVNMYGITETTVHASWAWLRPDEADTAESDIGDPLPGTSLHLLHSGGAPVIDRCVGEIFVGGPQVSVGYVGRPRETAVRFVPDPYSPVPGSRMYRSGDLARRNGSGISYLGRRDSQVQVNGFRVELSEIEAALASQPAVAAAGAAIADDESGARIVAVVVADGSHSDDDRASLSTADLLRGVRAVLPRYMVPHTITVVDELPLTNNGKLDRAAVLAAGTPVRALDGPGSAPPQGAAETLLLGLFAEVLHDESVSTASDFFDLGGDSMRAIRLVGLAQDRGLLLTVRDVYAAPKLTELAAHAVLAEAGVAEAPDKREPFRMLPADLAGSFADDVVDAYPMTALQTGMLYHQELAPGSGVYHIMLSYRVGGRMDPDAFRSAAQAVTDAHPVLRTSFDLSHSRGPMQRIHADVPVPLTFEDLSHLDQAGQEARIARVVEAEAATGFDLARPPLFRLVVLTRSADDYQLVFTHNHAILDGWSVNIFFEDLRARYTELLDGRAPLQVPQLRSTFADYVALEQRALHDPADQDFWRGRISPDAPLIAPDRSGAPVMRQLHVDLADTIRELRKAAARVGVPLKAMLLASHLRVVAWLTGHDEVVTSLVFGCRPEEQDSDRVLGLFLNQLPLWLNLGNQSWADLARQGHLAELDMMRHRWYPNALIQRHVGARPMFDSSFNFTDYFVTRQLVHEGSLEVLGGNEIESTHYAFASNFTVDVRTGELRALLEYDESALLRPTVALAAEAHRRILTAIITDADAAFRATALPGIADLTRLIESGQGAHDTDRAARVNGAPRGRVVRTPDAAEPTADGAGDLTAVPQTPLEHSVRQVWVEVLGAGDYGVHTSFFNAGGDSLTAMQVVSRVRARHGKLSMGTFMDAPTIADIARSVGASQLAAADAAGSAHEVTDQGGDEPHRYPLSRAQHQMWLIASRLPGLALFGMPGALQADGPLDIDTLSRTIASLIGRHEALRTRIATTDAGPEQVVEPHAELDIETVDCRGYSDPVTRCERLMTAAVREPHVLDRAPLMRVIVYRLGDDRHVIYLNIHHMISDGWSLTLLLQQAARAYRDLADGSGPADLPAPPAVGQLARARVKWTDSHEAELQRAYWVDRLAPPWSSLTDGPASRFARVELNTLAARLRSASCEQRLPSSAVESVRQAARRGGMTEFMVVLTGYASTLRTWSGQDDIRIATLLANRAEPGMEEIVGLVANTAVLRMRVDKDADPVDLSRQARAVCIDAYEHQELPFEDLLASLESRYSEEERTGSLFDAMVIVQEETPAVLPDEGLRFTPYRSASRALGTPVAATTCDFVLGVTRDEDELVLNLQYRPARTDKTVAIELLDDVAAAVVATARAIRER